MYNFKLSFSLPDCPTCSDFETLWQTVENLKKQVPNIITRLVAKKKNLQCFFKISAIKHNVAPWVLETKIVESFVSKTNIFVSKLS